MTSPEEWSAAVGDRVRRARAALQYSQADLARRMQLERTAVVKIESGIRNVSALELTRMADVLGLPLAYFVSPSPEPVAAYRASVTETQEESDVDAESAKFLLDVELEAHGRDAEWLLSKGFLEIAESFPSPKVESRDDALSLARLARARVGLPIEPLGSMVTVAERFGLYIKATGKGTSGASLQIAEGFGVAVVGSESEPGRRRATAAHELGHHLWGDKYNTDAGIATADNEKEKLVDAFASEFLLPASTVTAIPDVDDFGALRAALIKLAAEYRVSWSLAVNSARRIRDLDDSTARRLSAASPLRGDFLEVVGYEPRYDLAKSTSGPRWRRAVLAAYKAGLLTPERTVELVNGALSVDDLPAPDETAPPL